MGYFEIRVTVDRPLATVFSGYTNLEMWKGSPHILDAEWVQGTPWEEGSRIRLKISGPAGSTVDQVLTHFETNREVAYLSHFSGITMESRLSFRAISSEETLVHGRMEFVGALSRVVGFAVGPAIERGTKQFFEDLKMQCERFVPSEGLTEGLSEPSPESLTPDHREPQPEAGERSD
jgi:hypothetical protein